MTRLLATLCATSLLITQAQAAIEFQRDLPEDQRRSLDFDLATLDRMAPKEDDATTEAAQKMGITGRMTGPALRSWLEARTHIIVGQDWDIESNIKQTPGQSYPNSDLMPDLEKPAKQASDGKGEAKKGTVMVVMANIGTALYMYGKQTHSLLTLKLDPSHRERVLSPRVGLIKIGQGLFSERFRIEKDDATATPNTMLRLATLFHESRHSDGNGKSLGFVHAVCPEGHAYAGYSACDRNLNGPYTVGASMTKVMMNLCQDCTASAKEALRVRALDSYSRVLPTSNVQHSDADTKLLEVQVMICDLAAAIGEKEKPECAGYRTALKSSAHNSTIPTVNLDPTPEFIAE